MFSPNQKCIVHLTSGKTDVYGMAQPGKQVNEMCSVVKMNVMSGKTATKAEQSATRGSSRELEADTVILLTPITQARLSDDIQIQGYKFEIMSFLPRFDTQGNLNHVQVGCVLWEGA